MTRERLSIWWLLTLAVPCLYLLSAGSHAFDRYAVIPFGQTPWYVALVVAGFIVGLWSRDLLEAARVVLLLVFLQVAGHVLGYFATMWQLSGYEAAVLSLNLMYRPVLVYCTASLVVLGAASVVGTLLVSYFR